MNDNILTSLYQKYYADFREYSDVTSSHWRTIGGSAVELRNGKWSLQGIGFGDYRPAGPVKFLKSLPQNILSNYLLKKHAADARLTKLGKSVARRSGKIFDFDSAKHILSLQHILQKQPGGPSASSGWKTACVIGDGYGFMTALLAKAFPHLKVININLGRILFFDSYFCQKTLGDHPGVLIEDPAQIGPALRKSKVLFLEAEHYEWLRGLPIDLFVNIASMQEMTNSVIGTYFELMRSSTAPRKLFYCCNRVEKALPDGERIQFEAYPWKLGDVFHSNELCPWYQAFPCSRPPFWRKFAGPHQHRLAELS